MIERYGILHVKHIVEAWRRDIKKTGPGRRKSNFHAAAISDCTTSMEKVSERTRNEAGNLEGSKSMKEDVVHRTSFHVVHGSLEALDMLLPYVEELLLDGTMQYIIPVVL
jgi:hypothetical protein